jgi:hypothetical protein
MFNFIDWRSILIALAAGTILGGICAGGVVHKMDAADYRTLELSVSEAKTKAKDAATAKLEADRKAGDAIAGKQAAEGRLASVEFNQIRKDSRNVQENLRHFGVPDAVLPAGWVRNYNAAMSAGAGKAGAPAGRAPDPAGRSDPAQEDATPSGISQWELLDNTVDNAEGYASCRRQLNSLIDWALATSDP